LGWTICSLRSPPVREDHLCQQLKLTSVDFAGTAISWDSKFNKETEKELFPFVVDLTLNCACFVYIGAWLDFKAFNSPALGITPWRLVALFLCIVAFRRIPALLALYKWVPEINTWQEALFTGHFGKCRCL
jgi:NhaP-type Na+/H+ or K+/H+ antiporter